ncbi:hypothetical protein ACFQ3Z_41375 [Streptomyces nogalater]
MAEGGTTVAPARRDRTKSGARTAAPSSTAGAPSARGWTPGSISRPPSPSSAPCWSTRSTSSG